MGTPKPLTPAQASHALANRFGTRVDRIRQIATRLGIRPFRVFLVWSVWTGAERGEGEERIRARLEILPTPKVDSLENIAFRPMLAGMLPTGQLRVREISVNFTGDQLTGVAIPTQAFIDANDPALTTSGAELPAHGTRIHEPNDFYWEVVEDGRGDNPAPRQKYRLAAQPHRDAGNVQWIAVLERISQDNSRNGNPQNIANPDP